MGLIVELRLLHRHLNVGRHEVQALVQRRPQLRVVPTALVTYATGALVADAGLAHDGVVSDA